MWSQWHPYCGWHVCLNWTEEDHKRSSGQSPFTKLLRWALFLKHNLKLWLLWTSLVRQFNVHWYIVNLKTYVVHMFLGSCGFQWCGFHLWAFSKKALLSIAHHKTYVQWLWPWLRFFACLPSHLAPSWFNNTVGTVKIVRLPIWPKLFWDCPKYFGSRSVQSILENVRKAMLNIIWTKKKKWFWNLFRRLFF